MAQVSNAARDHNRNTILQTLERGRKVMERKFFGLVAALLVFLTGVLFAVNAPVQDVYNFDVTFIL